jgi:alkylation response protein AidB-like acyl-CoA dehydrogenase
MQEHPSQDAAQETQMLRERAADYVRQPGPNERASARHACRYEPAPRARMAELGWFGILVPEAHGGLGLGFAEMSVVLQELGKG